MLLPRKTHSRQIYTSSKSALVKAIADFKIEIVNQLRKDGGTSMVGTESALEPSTALQNFASCAVSGSPRGRIGRTIVNLTWISPQCFRLNAAPSAIADALLHPESAHVVSAMTQPASPLECGSSLTGLSGRAISKSTLRNWTAAKYRSVHIRGRNVRKHLNRY